MDTSILVTAFFASILAGLVNAIAGGGTLITFPLLTMLGIPAVAANINNTIALTPGYLSGTYAQLTELRGQRKRLLLLSPLCVAGGLLGGFLLIRTGEKSFRFLVPYLIAFASLLLALQPVIKQWSMKKHHQGIYLKALAITLIMFPAALYGGYFGAGVSVIIIAALGLVYDDTLNRLNALKQLASFLINISTAVYFALSEHVHWSLVVVMAAGAIAGGYTGGKIAGRINQNILRGIIVVLGVTASVYYFIAG